MPDTLSKQEPVNRTRRAIYVFGVTAWCLVCPAVAVYFEYDTSLAKIVVEGMLGLVPILIAFYLSTSMVDRSNILTNFGRAKVAQAKTPETVSARKFIVGDTETIGTKYRRSFG